MWDTCLYPQVLGQSSMTSRVRKAQGRAGCGFQEPAPGQRLLPWRGLYRIIRGVALVSHKVTLRLQQTDGPGSGEVSVRRHAALFGPETLLSFSSVLRMVLRPGAHLTSGRGASKRTHGVWENVPPWRVQQWTCSFRVLENFRKPFPFQGKALGDSTARHPPLHVIRAPVTGSSRKRAGEVSCRCLLGSC